MEDMATSTEKMTLSEVDHEDNLTGTTMLLIAADPSIPLTPDSFRVFPPELRQRIFCMSGVTKETLGGFVGDQAIYQDALKEYWLNVRCTIPNERRPWEFLRMNHKSVNSITKVKIGYTKFEHYRTCDGIYTRIHTIRSWQGWQSKSPPMSELVKLNVTDLRLSFVLNQDNAPVPTGMDVIGCVRDCVAAFSGTKPGLRSLSCEFRRIQTERQSFGPTICVLNVRFCLQGKLRSVDTGTSGSVVFFWEDLDKGANLTWPENHGLVQEPNSLEDPFALLVSPYYRKEASIGKVED